MAIETGTIILWLGARGAWDSTEWQEYTATQGYFVRGGTPASSGGATTHTHTLGSVVSGGAHTHSAKSFNYGNSTSSIDVVGGTEITIAPRVHTHSSTMTLNSGGSHTHTLSTSSTGNPSGSTEPAYKKLIYLIKL